MLLLTRCTAPSFSAVLNRWYLLPGFSDRGQSGQPGSYAPTHIVIPDQVLTQRDGSVRVQHEIVCEDRRRMIHMQVLRRQYDDTSMRVPRRLYDETHASTDTGVCRYQVAENLDGLVDTLKQLVTVSP